MLFLSFLLCLSPGSLNNWSLTTSSWTPSILSTLWREVCPRIMATCRRAIPICLAMNSQHCLFASLSTGGLVSFMRSALLWMPAISQREERGTTEMVSSIAPGLTEMISLWGCAGRNIFLISNVKIQRPNEIQMPKLYYLNFDIHLTFELCHLTLKRYSPALRRSPPSMPR